MSGKTKPVRKRLPVIPAGVEPAVSPQVHRSIPALISLAHSPLLPRSPSVSAVSLRKSQVPSKHKEGGPVVRKPSSEGEDSSVTVAVRVRPLNKREILMGASQVISMSANRTTITSTKGKAHFFNYDHSFWSVDSSTGEEVYASQELVYRELAQPLLDNSFRGYNTCLFAYGQTGSGKSYCIMGEGEEQGIVPRFMRELFDRIDGTSDSKNTFNVQVSYFEIYNEKVYDLLSSTSVKQHISGRKKNKLRVREHQVFGPYVEDLSTYVATCYSDIEHWLMMGNRFRATNATSMNDRSSRSHAIFSVTLTHTTVEEEEEHNTVSRINIIDLAGSERSKVSETSGERLKEGASINRSLHSLGKVISLLSERSTGKRDKVYIPYRDSTLTWLLKESLGGNSKTAMIATISPADFHYGETLNTLRYAQRTREIVNVARINEDPNIKMIRDLTSEINQLRELLTMQGGETGISEIKKLREQLSESEKLMSEATRSWQEKLQETERRKREELEQLKQTGALVVNNKLPNLVNLTEDPQLSEALLYMLKPGPTTVGNSGGSHDTDTKSHDIELTGALVVKNHCVFAHEGMSVSLEPSSNPDAQTFVNGQLLSAPKLLHHGDRVVLGGDYFFRYNYPLEVEGVVSSKKGHKDFEFARNELVKAQTERLEREWEEKILKERQEMLSELEGVQQTAKAEIDRQQMEYQQRIKDLSTEMETQSQHLTVEQQTKQAAETRMEELLRRNQALEEETVAQRHIIHLEKIKTEEESKELEQQRNQLMVDLEQEKQRLEDDIDKLHKNKNVRDSVVSPSSSESLLTNSQSSSSESSLLLIHRGSEVVRISVMLQEAAAICKALNKPLTFSREETSGVLTVRVSNTLLNLVTYWDMNKFETRLEQMREVYQARGSATSLEEHGTMSPVSSEDPFGSLSDDWAPSPLRSLQRTQRSYSLQSTPSMATPTSANRALPFNLYHTLQSRSAQSNSTPSLPLRNRLHPSVNPTVMVVLKQIGRLLDWTEDGSPGDVVERMAGHVHRMKKDSGELACLLQHPDSSSTTGELESVAVSLCCCLEALIEASKSLQQQFLQWHSLVPNYLLMEHTSAVDITLQLQQKLCHQTTLYCTKLMKGEESTGIAECCQEVHSSLDTVAEVLGQLLLVRAVQHRVLVTYLHPPAIVSNGTVTTTSRTITNGNSQEVWEESNQGATSWQWPPYESSLGPALVRGMCARCVATIDCAYQSVCRNLSIIRTQKNLPHVREAVQHLISSALGFLEWLHGVQEEIWCAEEEPCPPPLPSVVTMVTMLNQLAVSISTLGHALQDVSGHTSDTIRANSIEVVTACNQLAVAVLGVLKTSETGKALSSQVQVHSQLMSQAAKALNHLMKGALL